jgi:hypothetical protein
MDRYFGRLYYLVSIHAGVIADSVANHFTKDSIEMALGKMGNYTDTRR